MDVIYLLPLLVIKKGAKANGTPSRAYTNSFPDQQFFTPMDSKLFDFIPLVTPVCRKCNSFLFHHFRIVLEGDYAHSINSAGFLINSQNMYNAFPLCMLCHSKPHWLAHFLISKRQLSRITFNTAADLWAVF